ncbi:hypothetical protein CEE45_15075 [Candidatus Heimdallarchaeota archaeon B3_Heim]|nr:MAG: hypothetical protein CEE45_15075 [Candidatus Heimdallarchaeota archaeon B3_Heim]
MHRISRSSSRYTNYPLGLLRSVVVISDWISFADQNDIMATQWSYKNQSIKTIKNASVIFIPVDFSRIIQDDLSYILLYGAGIYWTNFSITSPQTITIDHRFLTGLLLPENKWLDNHFNTEPFIFPPGNDFIASDHLLEFPFTSLGEQNDIMGQRKRAFGRGIILAQLVFPFKEPLLMLRKATEGYNEFDSPNSPMRVLLSDFDHRQRINQIALEKSDIEYEVTIPGIQSIKADLLDFLPSKWSNEVYIKGLQREIAKIAKDFAFIGAPLILK